MSKCGVFSGLYFSVFGLNTEIYGKCNYQFEFRTNHSTNLCLSFLTYRILISFNESFLTGMILIDLQKVNTINRGILLKKTWCYRFFGSTYTMVFVKPRWTNILFRNKEPTLWIWQISCSVHQGCVLGPLVFLIYVSDISRAVKSNLFLYADDSCPMYQHTDFEEIAKQLGKEFENICNCFFDKKLSIHFVEDETKSFPFASKCKIKCVRMTKCKI